ncbi:MAG: hypothetical protein JWQ87_5517 [Candidatus Sulfotelmatobacter sp.]|nr:hypothetical protein [Candidatus Sulfotelmatobacter sp.]
MAPPILVPGTEKDNEGRAYLEDKQNFGLVRRFTADYIKNGTAHNEELKKYVHVDREFWKRLQAMIALRAVAESGDDPDTLKPSAEALKVRRVRRADRADAVLREWMPVAMMPLVLEQLTDENPPDAVKMAIASVMPTLLEVHRRRTGDTAPTMTALAQLILEGVFRRKLANPREEAQIALGLLWAEEMSSARLVLWWTDFFDGRPCRRFIPAIYCPDLKTALYVREALGERRVSVCLGCGELFVPDRPNELYHDRDCGDRHRHRRQRNKSMRSKTKRKKTGGS